eukprot:165423_1
MKIKEIFNPTGDAWGSTYIDDEFIKILNNFTHSKHIFYNKYDEDNDNITQTLYNKCVQARVPSKLYAGGTSYFEEAAHYEVHPLSNFAGPNSIIISYQLICQIYCYLWG